jgi:tRNA (guanine10-N2)-dimethyltransferase
MPNKKHIYALNYDRHESDLCKLESKYIFGIEDKNKLLFSNIKIDPSTSAFIKKRLDIISSSADYSLLISQIKNKKICIDDFKVEYLVLDGDTTGYENRLKKLRDVGFSIEGEPDYHNPKIKYGISKYNDIWYFGTLVSNNFEWHHHKKKPRSFSNSITMSIAKVLINIASKGDKEKELLDACCGVGTIMLEACFAGFTITGCDINEKTCKYVRENLSHFNYIAEVHHSDIKDISEKYDSTIIDLPYNLFTKVSDNNTSHIIESAARTSNQLIIVSTSDITESINNIGFKISDHCSIEKRGKTTFSRKIWVCDKILNESNPIDHA